LPRNIPEERSSHLLRGASLKSSGTLNKCSVAYVIIKIHFNVLLYINGPDRAQIGNVTSPPLRLYSTGVPAAHLAPTYLI
jgi:hypothetical protein